MHEIYKNKLLRELFLSFALICAPSIANADKFSLKSGAGINSTEKLVYIDGDKLNDISLVGVPQLRGSIAVIDFNNNTISKISPGLNDVVRSIILSRDNSKLFFLHTNSNEYSLSYIDLKDSGAQHKIADDVVYYDISPDGLSVVYIKGSRKGHSRETPFKPEGLYLFRINGDKIIKLADEAYQVSWEQFDNNIYYDKKGTFNNEIYKYDLKNSTEIKTSYTGLNFSSDGKFYCNILSEDEMPVYPEIRNSETNKVEISLSEFNTEECRWVNGNIVFVNMLNNVAVYNVVKNNILFTAGESEHTILTSGNNYFVMYKDGEWQLKNINDGKIIAVVKNTLFSHVSLKEYLKKLLMN